jgi:hypothetical protein
VRLAARLAGTECGAEPAISSLLGITAKEQRPYGLVCDVDGDEELVGLLTPAHKPPKPLPVGASSHAVVLDVHELDGIVDLSARKVRGVACT